MAAWLLCPVETASKNSPALQHAIWKTARVDGPLLDAMLSVFSKAREACNLLPLSREEVESTSLHEVFERKEVIRLRVHFHLFWSAHCKRHAQIA